MRLILIFAVVLILFLGYNELYVKYNFYIRDNTERIYRTDYYTIDKNHCIHFKDENKYDIIICGTFKIQ